MGHGTGAEMKEQRIQVGPWICPGPLPSPHSVYSLALGVLRLRWVGILGAVALVPLLASAWSFNIVQGNIIIQGDVGADGLPDPLAEERCLSCGRYFREQEGAMERGKELSQGALPSLHSTHSSSHSCWKCIVAPHSLSDQTPAWLPSGLVRSLFSPILSDLTSILATLVSRHARCPCLLSSLPVPPTYLLSLAWPLRTQSELTAPPPAPLPTPSVPQGGRLILGCGFPGESPSNSLLFRLHVLGVGRGAWLNTGLEWPFG